MKLRYYLRGLGIGVIVTAIIMGITAKPEELTDAQIKIRAAQLGMVEENVLADLDKSEEVALNEKDNKNESEFEEIKENETNKASEELTAEVNTEEASEVFSDIGEETTAVSSEKENIENSTQEQSSEEKKTTIVSSQKENMENNVQQESTEEEKQTTIISSQKDNDEKVENYILITVESGYGSHVVSQKLYEAGLVNSAYDYDQYLMENGYERRLRAGDHEIPADASYEEIAKILCKLN